MWEVALDQTTRDRTIVRSARFFASRAVETSSPGGFWRLRGRPLRSLAPASRHRELRWQGLLTAAGNFSLCYWHHRQTRTFVNVYKMLAHRARVPQRIPSIRLRGLRGRIVAPLLRDRSLFAELDPIAQSVSHADAIATDEPQRRRYRDRSPLCVLHRMCRSAMGRCRCRITIELRSKMLVTRSSTLLAAASAAILCGCAIRYDHAGVTRVGIGLWGFGDPPGVNWNLDWPPPREVPDLPPMAPRELSDLPRSFQAPSNDIPGVTSRDDAEGGNGVIDDNRCRAVHSNVLAQFAPLSARAALRDSSGPRS